MEDLVGWTMQHKERATVKRLEWPLDHFWANRKLAPILVNYFTSYSYMRDECFRLFKDYGGNYGKEFFNQNCVLAHLNNHGPSLEAGANVLFDYSTKPNPMDAF